MRRITAAVAGVILATSAAATVGTTSAQAAETWNGCPSGAVCIYPQNAGWNNNQPSHVFYSRGAHNLANQFGQHIVANNQTDGWKARTCTGYNGTGCEGDLPAGWYIEKDLTPINSIVLVP